MKNEGCPLRGLSLCDGHVLERPDHTAQACYCELYRLRLEASQPRAAQLALTQRDRLVYDAVPSARD